MAIAVVAGALLTLLPHRAVEVVVTVLFLGGAAYLLFVPESAEEEKGRARRPRPQRGAGRRRARWPLTAFVVIFIGEFGDLTQILAANFAAQLHQPWTVFFAALAALICVSALGAFGGRALLRVLPLARIRTAAASCSALAGFYSLYQVTFVMHRVPRAA